MQKLQSQRALGRLACSVARQSALIAALYGAGSCDLAWAQSSSAANAPAGASSPALDPAPPAAGFGDKLAEHGIYLRAFLNEETAGNPSGGIKQGTTFSQYAVGGADFDLGKLIGWQGAIFHASIIAEAGRGLSYEYIGGGVDAQENFAPFHLVRFLELSLEQNLSLVHKNDLNLVAGRIGESTYFARSDYACMFMNHVFCGSMYGFSQDTGTALAPLATWGGKATYHFTPKFYAQFGVFAIDPATTDVTVRLADISPNRVTGENYVGEVGYETNFSNDPMPRHYRFGTWYLDAPRNDVYLNSQNLPLPQYGGSKLVHNHESGAYLMGDQVIYRPDGASRRNVAVFGSALYSFADSEAVQYALKAGIVKTGTFAGRDQDTIGFAISDTRFTNKEVDFLSAMRAAGGGGGRVAANEFILEANYGYALAPGIVVRPNLQYIINPDPRYTPTYPRKIPNAFVVGVQITANLGALFGMPRVSQ